MPGRHYTFLKIMRRTKHFHYFVLAAFWVFTWHAYAYGITPSETSPRAGQATVLKDSLSGASGYRDVKDPFKFKRRPFIVKAEALAVGPSVVTQPLPFVETLLLSNDAPSRALFIRAASQRGPPAR
jgi:hypothetical protein